VASTIRQSFDHNIELIDLTQKSEWSSTPERAERIESPPTPTTKITQLFNGIEQYLLTLGYIK